MTISVTMQDVTKAEARTVEGGRFSFVAIDDGSNLGGGVSLIFKLPTHVADAQAVADAINAAVSVKPQEAIAA